jgi:hypothetical protein
MKSFLALIILCCISLLLPAQDFVYPRLPAKAKKLSKFIPTGWHIRDSASGDLNNDGRPDLAFTLEYKEAVLEARPDSIPNFARPRLLVILLKDPKRAQYHLHLQHNTFVLREGEGGMNPDPPTHVRIRNNRLVLEIEFTRSSIYYTFEFRDNDFYLVAASTVNASSDAIESWEYDFLKGRAVREYRLKEQEKGDREEVTVPEPSLKKLRDLSMPYRLEVFPDIYI